MSNIKSQNYQVGINADPTKNITLSNDASGDLVIQSGTVETSLTEVARFKQSGGMEYLPNGAGAVPT